MKLKYIFSLMLAATVLFLSTNVFALEYNVKIEVNGNMLQMDQQPTIYEGTTLVPLRAIFEALGAEIEWDEQTKSVKATKNDVQIELKIDSREAKYNDTKIILGTPAMVINNRTLVPLRFVSEALGADVKWNGATNTVAINLDEKAVSEEIKYEDFLELNKEYVSNDNGMTVKVTSIDVNKKEGYDEYTIHYKQKNNQKDIKVPEGNFTIYFENDEPLEQYGFFNDIFPTDSLERSYTFKVLKNQNPQYIEYGSIGNSRTKNTLRWEIK